MNEIGIKNAEMGRGAARNRKPRTFLIRQMPLQGASHSLLNGPLEKRWGVKGVERKGGSQGTRANGQKLCSWEIGILDTL